MGMESFLSQFQLAVFVSSTFFLQLIEKAY